MSVAGHVGDILGDAVGEHVLVVEMDVARDDGGGGGVVPQGDVAVKAHGMGVTGAQGSLADGQFPPPDAAIKYHIEKEGTDPRTLRENSVKITI